jgi:DNA-binding NtrC family response regulator
MPNSDLPPSRLLALTAPEAKDVLARAAGAAGLELIHTTRLSGLLEALQEGPSTATLLSLAVDPVDEDVVRRLSDEANSGNLLLSARDVSLERALLMERVGAVALLREPLDESELAGRLAGVAEEGTAVPIPEHEAPTDGRPELIGSSPAMAGLFETLVRVARSPSTVLITGESGTGKEVVARTVHWASDRRDAPFVGVNCAAIPEHLLESELFGHEKGSFTGAVERRRGRFERADGGTLFLDEIGDMSLVLQAKILRVLEERTLERVGSESTTPVDVRVVAATNQELDRRIHDGLFREDLYYRLAVVDLHLPPLRDRVSDIRELALHFAGTFARRYERPVTAISEKALHRLAAHAWPGNVRELRNVMDRAVLLASGASLRSSELRLGAGSPRASARREGVAGGAYRADLSLQEVEADHIRRVLTFVDGHMGKAASTLGIHRNTLTRKVQEYGLADAVPAEEST